MILLLFFLSYWLGISFHKSWIAFLIVAIVFMFFIFRRFKKRVGIIAISIFLLGTGVSFVKVSNNKDIYSGIVIESKDNYYIFQSSFEKFYIYEKENEKEIGDILTIKGQKEKLSFSTLESSFDFENYLNNKGVYSELNVSALSVRYSNFIRIKSIKKRFLGHFNPETKAVLSSIMFSDSLDSETTSLMQDLHLGRLMSASGLYIYAFINGIEFLLRKKLSEKWSRLLTLGLLSFYFVCTFPRFAVIKIFIISMLRWLNNYKFKKVFDNNTILGLTGIFFLIIDYHFAYQDGFILGYLIPIAVSCFQNVINNKKSIIKKLLMPLLIFLFFIPFELKYYHSIEPLNFINQLILTPWFTLIASISLMSFYGLPVFKIIDYLVFPLRYFLKGLTYVNLEFYAPEMNEIGIIVYYLLFFALLYYISIKFKPFIKPLAFLNAFFICLHFLPVSNLLTEEVNFINVGQGDACLIRKGTSSIFIDVGGLKYKDVAKDSLIPYLKKKKIYKIDLVITTHDDYDHSGSLSSLAKNFTIKKYIKYDKDFPIKMNGITLKNYNKYADYESDENAKSLVLGFNLLNMDFLIMGDAPVNIERKIMEDNKYIPCDILKIGHHGSDTSTSKEFINYVKPKEAIVSVGKNNSYHHPHKSVIELLKESKVNIRRTDEEGTIGYINYIFM